MLCQNCGKNEATTHIKQVINGDTAERHLCSECAEHLGYGDAFSGFGFNISGLFEYCMEHCLMGVKSVKFILLAKDFF